MKLPYAPLDRRLPANDADAADLAGVTRRTIIRWRRRGIDFYEADRACARAGLHLFDVWGECADPLPEPETRDRFGGYPDWYRATGAADWYGDPVADSIRGGA